MKDLLKKVKGALFTEVDPTVVSLFRIVFGAVMVYQMLYYYSIDYTFQFMAGPEVLFPFQGFEFVKPLSLPVLKLIHFSLLVAAILMMVGIFYRVATTYFFLGYTYFFLIDNTLFNNHTYLMALISGVMIFITADNSFRLPFFRKRPPGALIPAWNRYLLIFCISLPYFFGGIAKLHPNWWKTDLVPIILEGNNDSLITSIFPLKFLTSFITYTGLVYDLVIIFLLLNKKTRIFGLVLVVIFNFSNHAILFDDIGVFPLMMIFSTVLFFEGKEIKSFIKRREPKKKKRKNKGLKTKPQIIAKRNSSSNSSLWQNATAITLLVFVLVHILLPFRWMLHTDNPEWTGIGSRFAWRMKMQTRKMTNVKMTLTDRKTGASGPIELETFLSSNQYNHVFNDPHNLIHLAKYLSIKISAERGFVDPIIRADISVSFCGLPPQKMIDPNVDLTKVKINRYQKNHPWLLPLNPF
ncbi:MAG: HTTM domain-containing protein [Saprospiraceae bacterium]|nr:HTTM domain-containing protein [Saprospiraceae bacterium]